MKITIEIPKEFEKDFTDDKFNDFFERISADLEYVVCGRYEKETLKMMHHAFYDAQNVPDTNVGDCISRKKMIEDIKSGRLYGADFRLDSIEEDCLIDEINNQPQAQSIIDDKAKLKSKLMEYFAIGDSFAYNCTRCNEAWAVGTMSLNDFEQFTEENIDDLIDWLTKKEV